MPAKHIIRQFTPHSYFHIFNRGVAKQPIFLDQADKQYFLDIFDRHLNPNSKQLDKTGVPYRKFNEELQLLCFCLMKNHFHLLIYLENDLKAISEFMKSVGTAYTMYFNLKYKRVGPIFQGTFKASRITNDAYLIHITRYIHLNPRFYQTYKYSSLPAYIGTGSWPWLEPDKVLNEFDRSEYLGFVKDYQAHKRILDSIKQQLANS